MLAQNAAIERLAKKDARIPCSKNKEMTDSSTDGHGYVRVEPTPANAEVRRNLICLSSPPNPCASVSIHG
jgi:hypothetical protein